MVGVAGSQFRLNPTSSLTERAKDVRHVALVEDRLLDDPAPENLAFKFYMYTKDSLGGVPREQKMLKGKLPRVIYNRVYFCIRRGK